MREIIAVLEKQQAALEKSGMFLRGSAAREDFDQAGALLAAIKSGSAPAAGGKKKK